MRSIINYLRSLFCKHDFTYEEKHCTVTSDLGSSKAGLKVSRTCKKCGWHKSYWKF